MSAADPLAEDVTIAESASVCIIGLGYVGLPLAMAFDDVGLVTTGYDIDTNRIDAFSSGRDPTDEVGDETIEESDVTFSMDPAAIAEADYVLVTVPTPLDKVRTPQLTFVEEAARTIGHHLKPGATVVLESTVYPGVTRETLAPIIAEESGLTPTAEFSFGYSPERLSPGEGGVQLADAVKIVGGDTPETRAELAALYDLIVDAGVYEAPSIETAEAAKVLENVQRDLNIALMNEMALICEHLDLDTHEVIDACSTKWNFHKYTPGLVGGHCIPVDPLYLAHGSERAGFSPNLILQGREINEYMPKHVSELTTKALNAGGKVLRDSSILILGVSYKPNVKDTRTSEVKNVIRQLAEYGVNCTIHDPIADATAVEKEFGVERQERLSFVGFDGVLVTTPHDSFEELDFRKAIKALAPNPVFIDVHGTFDGSTLDELGYEYRRL